MTEVETLPSAPPIKPPDVPPVAIATEPEEAPKSVTVGIRYETKGIPKKAKFTRDPGYKKQDGTPLIQEYDETYTEDKCPKDPGHDLNEIIGERNGHKLVQCVFCAYTVFESAEKAN